MLKKLFLGLIICLTINAHAQSDYFDGGIIGGFDVSQIDGDMLGGFNKAGLIAGAFVSRSFTPQWTGRIELKLIQKGKINPADPENGDLTYLKVRLNYIQLPILAEYRLTTLLSAEGGFGVGYLVASGFYDEYGKFSEQDEPNAFDPLEFSYMLGVNFYINERWRANVRWSYSFIPIADLLGDDVTSTLWWKNPGRQYNRTLEFTMLYTL